MIAFDSSSTWSWRDFGEAASVHCQTPLSLRLNACTVLSESKRFLLITPRLWSRPESFWVRIMVSVLALGRHTKSPRVPFGALEMHSPGVACAKGARGLWGHHSKVLLSLMPSQAHFSLQQSTTWMPLSLQKYKWVLTLYSLTVHWHLLKPYTPMGLIG